MYLSLRDRPTTQRSAPDAPGRTRVNRVVVTLGVVSLLTDIASESAAAILPLYLTAVVGLSPAAYGLVEGLYQGVSALVRVGAGIAADRTDRPWGIAMLGYATSLVARVLLLLATGLAAISAVITLDRLGKGIRTAPRDAMISASSAPDDLGRSFGVHRALDAAGAAIGPLIAFAILWLIPSGYRVVLVVSVGFAVLGVAVLGLFVPPDTGTRRRPAAPRPARAEQPLRVRGLFTRPFRRLLVVSGGLGLLTIGDGFVYLALLETGGFAAHWFPAMYVGANIAFLALAVPCGRLADRVGRVRVLLLGHLLLAAAYSWAAGAGSLAGPLAVLGALVLLGGYYAATDGVLAAVAGQMAPERLRASGIAAAQTVVAVSRMVAAAGFGLLWVTVGPQQALVVVAAALVVLVPAGVALLRGRP